MDRTPVTVETIYKLARVIEPLSVGHAFIGGVAMGAWAIPRATFDLDLTLSLPHPEQALLDAFREAGFDVGRVFDHGFRDRIAGMEKLHVSMPVERTLLTVDLFVANTPFLGSVLERRVAVEMGHGPVWVCTASDLILFKLVADRRKDQIDIESLVAVQGIREVEYLKQWSRTLGVEDRLQRLLEPER